MNADDFKPGDLAYATVGTERDVRLLRGTDGDWTDGGVTGDHGERRYWFSDTDVTDLRRAHVLPPDTTSPPEGSVTLDPEDIGPLWTQFQGRRERGVQPRQALIDSVRALAAEQANPVPPEPPQWSVVEADYDAGVDGAVARGRYVRTGESWLNIEGGWVTDWGRLIKPTVLHDASPDTCDHCGEPIGAGECWECDDQRAADSLDEQAVDARIEGRAG